MAKDGRKRRKEGYLDRSPAVCVVAYDLAGNPVSDAVATRIINAVFEVTQEERLAISFTRT